MQITEIKWFVPKASAASGAGGPEFKSPRPDHFFSPNSHCRAPPQFFSIFGDARCGHCVFLADFKLGQLSVDAVNGGNLTDMTVGVVTFVVSSKKEGFWLYP